MNERSQRQIDWTLVCNLSDDELAAEMKAIHTAYIRGEADEVDEDFVNLVRTMMSFRWLYDHAANSSVAARIEEALGRGVAVCGRGPVYHLSWKCPTVGLAHERNLPGWGAMTSFYTNSGEQRRLCKTCARIARKETV
jgi:hypothetical protein